MPSIINSTTTNGIVVSGDNSGSLQLASNNGTTAVTIDGSQNVGIGTTSPIAKLDVRGSGAYFYDNSTTDFQLTVGSSISTIGTTTATPLAFKTNSTERMRISSAGVITTPFRPAFVATATGFSGYTSVAENNPFPANTTNYNQGSCFNTSNYRFTAPITGLYLFTFSALSNNSSAGSRPGIFVNGSSVYNSIQHGISNQDADGSNSNTTSSLIYLQANDYVFAASSSGSLYYYGQSHSSFSGCLIG